MREGHRPMEELEVFKRFAAAADKIWSIVMLWDPFVRDTVGKQLVRAADSVGANLVEGDGRYSDKESIQFFSIARGSAREARYWLQRAILRNIVDAETGEECIHSRRSATQLLNRLITYRRGGFRDTVKEPRSTYRPRLFDPFAVRGETVEETEDSPERLNA